MKKTLYILLITAFLVPSYSFAATFESMRNRTIKYMKDEYGLLQRSIATVKKFARREKLSEEEIKDLQSARNQVAIAGGIILALFTGGWLLKKLTSDTPGTPPPPSVPPVQSRPGQAIPRKTLADQLEERRAAGLRKQQEQAPAQEQSGQEELPPVDEPGEPRDVSASSLNLSRIPTPVVEPSEYGVPSSQLPPRTVEQEEALRPSLTQSVIEAELPPIPMSASIITSPRPAPTVAEPQPEASEEELSGPLAPPSAPPAPQSRPAQIVPRTFAEELEAKRAAGLKKASVEPRTPVKQAAKPIVKQSVPPMTELEKKIAASQQRRKQQPQQQTLVPPSQQQASPVSRGRYVPGLRETQRPKAEPQITITPLPTQDPDALALQLQQTAMFERAQKEKEARKAREEEVAEEVEKWEAELSKSQLGQIERDKAAQQRRASEEQQKREQAQERARQQSIAKASAPSLTVSQEDIRKAKLAEEARQARIAEAAKQAELTEARAAKLEAMKRAAYGTASEESSSPEASSLGESHYGN